MNANIGASGRMACQSFAEALQVHMGMEKNHE